MTFIGVLVAALVAGLLVKIPTWVFCKLTHRETPPVIAYVAIPMFLIGCGLGFKAEVDIYHTNKVRLAEWEAAQCVAPSVVTQSVFLAEGRGSGAGTAFALEGDLIVTNRHVADAITAEGQFTTADDTTLQGMMFHRADENTSPDLAFYYARGLAQVPQLPLATEGASIGDRLLIVGNPAARDNFYSSVVEVLAEGTEDTLESPQTSAMTWVYESLFMTYMSIAHSSALTDDGANNSPFYVSHGDTGPGNSGSPVVNCAGEVVGVHFGGRGLILFADEQAGMSVTLEGLTAEIEKLPPAEMPEEDESVG